MARGNISCLLGGLVLGFAVALPINAPTGQAEVRQQPVAFELSVPLSAPDELLVAPIAPEHFPPMSPVPFHGVGIFDEKGGAIAIKFQTEDGRFYEIPFAAAGPQTPPKKAKGGLKPTRNPRGNVNNLPLDRN